MKLVERFWTTLTQVFSIFIASPFSSEVGNGVQQHPLNQVNPLLELPEGPVFIPPGVSPDPDDRNGPLFECDYRAMRGWKECSTRTRRGCWLEDGKGGIFSLNTDYEKSAPIGVLRKYNLTLGAHNINTDGKNFTEAKTFNKEYPGPWIQACWGDTIEVTVTVEEGFYQGTAVHWHGIRQLRSLEMDGVPGVTQCPIAPQSTFVYNFSAIQYGSSWYHSHYSLQYADGALGPLTIHGPTTAPYDEAATLPLLVTDWDHRSAFDIINDSSLSDNKTILLNGKGNVTRSWYKKNPEPHDKPVVFSKTVPKPTHITFKPHTKYLLRVINTAYDATFLFSIDNHLLTVVSADFVPIAPYTTEGITVGIGQRYDIIVQADPLTVGTNKIPDDGNFWIRAYFVNKCFGDPPEGDNYSEIGIIRYDKRSTALPHSARWLDMDIDTCQGEVGWKPWYPWIVGKKSNGNEEQDVRFVKNRTYQHGVFALAPPEAPMAALQVNYTNITFAHLDNTGTWPKPWVIVAEDGTENSWIYLALTGTKARAGAHPIHLHGHDFAVLAQEANKKYDPKTVVLNTQNPQRRDVVLLPDNGYVVIAFKTDNPGAWLMHCHIARHASEGLALQLLEDRAKANEMWPKGSKTQLAAEKLCNEWKAWGGPDVLNDSGI